MTRQAHEIAHGRHLAESGAHSVWNWASPAGRRRWARRAAWLSGQIRAKERVLELGCGTGLLTRELLNRGARVTALDISPDLLALAARDLHGVPVDWIQGDACNTGLPAREYDWVVGSSVLHHLDLTAALAELIRVLKPGGWIRFTEPNMLNPQIAVQKNVPAIKRWLGDSPDETAFVRWHLARALRQQGFESVALTPFDFLHPAIPGFAVGAVEAVAAALERVPLLREIAGSLMIEARTPRDPEWSRR